MMKMAVSASMASNMNTKTANPSGLRRSHVQDHLRAEVPWLQTNDPNRPYEAKMDSGTWMVRVNNFSDQHLFTLLIDGQEQESFDEWPVHWLRPEDARTI